MSTKNITPPPPSTIAPTATATSVSSMTGSGTGRSSNYRRHNQGGRKQVSDQSYVKTKEDDLNFLGVKEEYRVVVGGPSENLHLKYGVNYPEFSNTMRDRMASEFPYGQYLLCLFNDLKDPLELPDVKDMPKKDRNIDDEDERKLLWKLKMNEWNKRKEFLMETLKKVYSKLAIVRAFGKTDHAV